MAGIVYASLLPYAATLGTTLGIGAGCMHSFLVGKRGHPGWKVFGLSTIAVYGAGATYAEAECAREPEVPRRITINARTLMYDLVNATTGCFILAYCMTVGFRGSAASVGRHIEPPKVTYPPQKRGYK